MDKIIKVTDDTRIRIVHDLIPENPIKDADIGASFTVNYKGQESHYGLSIDIPQLSKSAIRQNLSDIKDIIGTIAFSELMENFTKEEIAAQDDDIIDAINDAIDTAITDLSGADKFNTMANIFTMAGYKALSDSGSGYCQGSYHECLIVLDPEEEGFSDPDKALKGLSELYTAYAYGDCYGYITERKAHCDACGNTEWNEIDSCWGFYGDTESEGYKHMIEQAKENICD